MANSLSLQRESEVSWATLPLCCGTSPSEEVPCEAARKTRPTYEPTVLGGLLDNRFTVGPFAS